MKKHHLITGASGYIGSHIAEFLLKKNISCVLFDKKKIKIFQKKISYFGRHL